MYQPTNVESQPPEKIVATGTVNGVTVYASSDGKACLAAVIVSKTANRVVELLTSDANICDLFGKAKEGGLKLSFEGMKVDLSVIPQGLERISTQISLYLCIVYIKFSSIDNVRNRDS